MQLAKIDPVLCVTPCSMDVSAPFSHAPGRGTLRVQRHSVVRPVNTWWLRWLFLILLILQAGAVHADAKSEARRALELKGIVFNEGRFFNAISARETEAVELFLKAGMDANARDPDERNDGWRAIHLATYNGNYSIVKLLLQYGAHLDERAPGRWDGSAPLSFALQRGHLELAKFLLNKGADVNWRGTRSGISVLHMAASTGPLELVKLLVDKGALINVTGEIGLTPLEAALRGSQPDVAEFLIERGSDLNEQRRDSAFQMAARYGHRRIVEILIQRGANINSRDVVSWWTPLHWAARNRHKDVVNILINHGGNVNALSKDRETPIHAAAWWGNTDIVALLISKGADVNAKDRRNRTALYNALSTAAGNTALLVLQQGAEVNVVSDEGETPLMAAAQHGLNEIIEQLMRKGAIIDLRNKRGLSALDIARIAQRPTTAELLVSLGAQK